MATVNYCITEVQFYELHIHLVFESVQVASFYAAVKYLKRHNRFFEEVPL